MGRKALLFKEIIMVAMLEFRRLEESNRTRTSQRLRSAGNRDVTEAPAVIIKISVNKSRQRNKGATA